MGSNRWLLLPAGVRMVVKEMNKQTEWLLEFEDVHYTYPGSERQALAGLTLRIPEGRKSVILGHNGCGKSTLFLHANGIYRPQRGTVRWRGQPIRYERRFLADLRQRIGLVFQDPEQQLVANTVAEDLSYGLCNRKLPPAEIVRRVRLALARFDLADLADTPVHHLSLGQKKRVALAGVMVLRPELLLLDEPTAYLDRLQLGKLMKELDRIAEEGTTVVMATHDLEVAYAWADRIFVMHRGRIALEGTPDEVFSRRGFMTELQLGVPLLFDMWEALLRQTHQQGFPFPARPRTIAELKERLCQISVEMRSASRPDSPDIGD